jgi:hypothetical protein
VIAYELGEAASRSRALAVASVRAVAALAPLGLAVELLTRNGWRPPALFWAVAGSIAALVLVRAFVQYGTAARRLRSLRVTVDRDAITARTVRETQVIPRAKVARIVEVEGPLGGLRVEAHPDPRSGVAMSASVPGGGPAFADLRAELEGWQAIQRRGRSGPAVRVVVALGVVAALFFLPFVLDEVVLRSHWVAGLAVVFVWAAMRWAMRGR